MNAEEFRQAGREMVDFIADYLENIGERRVLPEVVPGFMKDLIPSEAPEEPEEWDKIMPDIERVIMPGVSTCWRHDMDMFAVLLALCVGNPGFPSRRDNNANLVTCFLCCYPWQALNMGSCSPHGQGWGVCRMNFCSNRSGKFSKRYPKGVTKHRKKKFVK